jgi:NAD(P)-dependent dehydrogenase (short-subunit alcohol dehydrogenase family)
MRFTNKVCLVTGGASGIGRATCERFGAEGGVAIVVDVDDEGGNQTVNTITAAGGRAIFVKADVSVSADVQAVVKRVVNDFGRIDVLVNNAATQTFKRVVDLEEDEWDRVIAVNLRSVFLFCKYCLPHMENGVIVNVSSVHAHEAGTNVAPYASSKGGLEAFTRALSREYKPSNIRVNCVAPGGVNTPMLWTNPAIKEMNRNDVLYCEPEQIAAVICFLASAEASPINGTTVMADMGLLAEL